MTHQERKETIEGRIADAIASHSGGDGVQMPLTFTEKMGVGSKKYNVTLCESCFISLYMLEAKMWPVGMDSTSMTTNIWALPDRHPARNRLVHLGSGVLPFRLDARPCLPSLAVASPFRLATSRH